MSVERPRFSWPIAESIGSDNSQERQRGRLSFVNYLDGIPTHNLFYGTQPVGATMVCIRCRVNANCYAFLLLICRSPQEGC